MAADPMAADMHTAAAALVRLELERKGATALLDRFLAEPWTMRRVGDLYPTSVYLVTFDRTGEALCTIPADDLAYAVGNLRAMRGQYN